MGGGPEKETLLFIFQEDEPKQVTDKLRKNFPYIEVIYHKLAKPQPGKTMGGIAYSFDTISEELWAKATILVTLGSLPPDPKLAPNLRYIHLLSAGVDHFLNHPVFQETDIPITTVSGITGPPIAEWVLMTTLNLTKNYGIMYENQKKRNWDSKAPGLMKRGDWHGKIVGICGYGSIGRQVARVYHAMGSSIHAYNSSLRATPESRKDTGYVLPNTGDPDGTLPQAWYSAHDEAGLHTFLSSGLDMLVMCVPLTDSTRGMIGEAEFDVLYKASLEKYKETQSDSATSDIVAKQLSEGEGCIFVNLSRGAVVKTDALISALKDKKLLGAALDVTDPEPLSEDSELWGLENAIVTPHISALGKEYLERGFGVLTENLRRREQGDKLLNEVNRKTGYRGP